MRGPGGGGVSGWVCERRRGEEGGTWQLQGEGQRKLPDIMNCMVVKLTTL